MFNLATLFVDVVARTAAFDRQLQGIHGQLTRADMAVSAFAGNVAAMFARAAISMAGDLFEGTIHSAAHMTEAINRSDVVFGGASREIIKNANDMAVAFSMPKKAVLDAGASFGMLGKSAGMSKDEAAGFGVELAKIGIDVKSFNDDFTLDEVMRKMKSGLEGMNRPMRDFGVFIDEAMVKEEAMRLGLGKDSNISQGDKIQARASLMKKQLEDLGVIGDMARTFGSPENQITAFWGALSNLGTSIGETLLPAFSQLLAIGNDAVHGLAASFESNKETFKGWVASFMDGVNMVGMIWRNFGDIWEITTASLAKEHVTFMGNFKSTWAGVGAWLLTGLGDITGAILNAAAMMGSYLLLPGEYFVKGMTKAIEIVGGIWDAFVGVFATGMDYLLRPLRDMYNKLTGETMTVEQDFGRLKGIFDGPASLFKGGADRIASLRQGIIGAGQEGAKGVQAWAQSGAAAMNNWGEAARAGAEDAGKAIDDQIKAAQDRIAGREAAAAGTPAKPKTDAQLMAESATRTEGMMTKLGGDDEEGASKFKAELLGAADFASKLRLAQGGSDVPQKQLTELQQIREQEKTNGDALARMADRAFGAILA